MSFRRPRRLSSLIATERERTRSRASKTRAKPPRPILAHHLEAPRHCHAPVEFDRSARLPCPPAYEPPGEAADSKAEGCRHPWRLSQVLVIAAERSLCHQPDSWEIAPTSSGGASATVFDVQTGDGRPLGRVAPWRASRRRFHSCSRRETSSSAATRDHARVWASHPRVSGSACSRCRIELMTCSRNSVRTCGLVCPPFAETPRFAPGCYTLAWHAWLRRRARSLIAASAALSPAEEMSRLAAEVRSDYRVVT